MMEALLPEIFMEPAVEKGNLNFYPTASFKKFVWNRNRKTNFQTHLAVLI